MLAIPERGLIRSINVHNVEFAVFCDWIEASALFSGEDVTGADIVDLLHENEIYADQDFAWELVHDAFSAIKARGRLLGHSYPIKMGSGARITGVNSWQDFPAYSFCLVLSLPSVYPSWARSFGADYTEQGMLFEQFTAESLAAAFQDWTILTTGWSRTAPKHLGDIVTSLAARLGEATGDIARWTTKGAKEAGLDILCFRPFADGRCGIPVYLMQCASGLDWRSKLKTPDIRIWKKVITFAADPKKAFSMPYALEEAEFIRHTNVVDGMLLDRSRLLAPGSEHKEWLTPGLTTKLNAWMTPRVTTLPQSPVVF